MDKNKDPTRRPKRTDVRFFVRFDPNPAQIWARFGSRARSSVSILTHPSHLMEVPHVSDPPTFPLISSSLSFLCGRRWGLAARHDGGRTGQAQGRRRAGEWQQQQRTGGGDEDALAAAGSAQASTRAYHPCRFTVPASLSPCTAHRQPQPFRPQLGLAS